MVSKGGGIKFVMKEAVNQVECLRSIESRTSKYVRVFTGPASGLNGCLDGRMIRETAVARWASLQVRNLESLDFDKRSVKVQGK